jgi:hypothetical protein
MGCTDADFIELLVDLTTHRGRLPQGAPTSSAIANLVLSGVDQRVYLEAQRRGCRSTRCCDDYGFSGSSGNSVEGLVRFLSDELAPLGLKLNSKTRVMGQHQEQILHGLSIGHGPVTVPQEVRRALARDVHHAVVRGCTYKKFMKLQGRINYVALLHAGEARRLQGKLSSARQTQT